MTDRSVSYCKVSPRVPAQTGGEQPTGALRGHVDTGQSDAHAMDDDSTVNEPEVCPIQIVGRFKNSAHADRSIRRNESEPVLNRDADDP